MRGITNACSYHRQNRAGLHFTDHGWQDKFHCMNCWSKGPVVLAFFKVSCPVCQFAFPYYERIARAHHDDKGATFLGICQNKAADAKAFAREYGVTFPIALDNDANGYAVSNAYGLTNVPTLFYIDTDREIEVSSVGWSKAEVEEVNARLRDRQQHGRTCYLDCGRRHSGLPRWLRVQELIRGRGSKSPLANIFLIPPVARSSGQLVPRVSPARSPQ